MFCAGFVLLRPGPPHHNKKTQAEAAEYEQENGFETDHAPAHTAIDDSLCRVVGINEDQDCFAARMSAAEITTDVDLVVTDIVGAAAKRHTRADEAIA